MSDGSMMSAPGIPGAFASGMSGSTVIMSRPHCGHVTTVASLFAPQSGHVFVKTKLAGLKHIRFSLPKGLRL